MQGNWGETWNNQCWSQMKKRTTIITKHMIHSLYNEIVVSRIFKNNIISQESSLPPQTRHKKTSKILCYLKIRSSNIQNLPINNGINLFSPPKNLWNPHKLCINIPPKTKAPHPCLPGLPWRTPNPSVQSSVKTGRALRKPCKPHWRLRNLHIFAVSHKVGPLPVISRV